MKIEKIQVSGEERMKMTLMTKGDVLLSFPFTLWVKIDGDIVFRFCNDRLSFLEGKDKVEIIFSNDLFYKVDLNENEDEDH